MKLNKRNGIGNMTIIVGVCLVILGLMILSPLLVFMWLAWS